MTRLPVATDAPMTDTDDLFAQASGWYFRLQADDVTPADTAAFAAWHAQGVAQAQAWQEVIDLLGALREPARSIRHAQREQWCAPAKRRWRPLASAAAVLLVIGLGITHTPYLDRMRADYATATGESRTLQLADGSTLQLNTDTAVQVRLLAGERQVRLLRGEAWFEVTRDPARPFVVSADDGWVKVLGTRFSVARREAHTRVQVAQGKVEVSAGNGASVYLEPGRAVEYHAGKLARVQAFEPASGFAWRQRQLVFRQQPLAEVVDELNRYWPGQTLVLGEALRQRKVSGVFDIDKPEAVLKALSHTLGVTASQYTGYLRVLREG